MIDKFKNLFKKETEIKYIKVTAEKFVEVPTKEEAHFTYNVITGRLQVI